MRIGDGRLEIARSHGCPKPDYENWRWEARNCEIPWFNGAYMLEKLRWERVVIIGDSLDRNQWESLACLLYSSVRLSRAIVKIHRSVRVFRAKDQYLCDLVSTPMIIFIGSNNDYDCSEEFVWSPFLVNLGENKTGLKVIKLEKLSESARQWQGADVMIFDTGCWWTHHGRKKLWNYSEYRGKLVDMKLYTAFKIAMTTWARWIDQKVDPAKASVFFRSILPVQKKMNLQWCFNQIQLITNDTYVQWFPRPMVSMVDKTIQDMKTPVRYLNITELSQYRQDAHLSIYTTRKWKLLTKDQQNNTDEYANCDHWCLPGLPDTWNVLLYASIIETPSVCLWF